MQQKNVLIRDDQQEWLDAIDYINFSAFVRTKLDQFIEETEGSVRTGTDIAPEEAYLR